MKRLLLLITLFIAVSPMLALAHEGGDHPTPHPTSSGTVQFPADGQTPGERSPWVAAVAATTIIGTGVAGIYIYRLIKKGI
ncbi:MAG TPA: hypothetical protein VNA87_06015 [Actinomycetota bacterium]|nr:hypothetical protein [Actinomycetota bacterium]